jgi:hypothetical protein
MEEIAMPQSTQAAHPKSTIEDYFAGLAAACGAAWDTDSAELSMSPHFRPRMFAWAVTLSSALWCTLILAGHELWKVWR